MMFSLFPFVYADLRLPAALPLSNLTTKKRMTRYTAIASTTVPYSMIQSSTTSNCIVVALMISISYASDTVHILVKLPLECMAGPEHFRLCCRHAVWQRASWPLLP